MNTRTAEWCVGRWPYILSSFGIDQKYLVDVHGPCPNCGGEDRFRFDDKDGRGTWFCNNCGNGDGFDLLEACTGRTFKDLAEQIMKELKIHAPAPEVFKPQRTVDAARAALNKVWGAAKVPELVTEYLNNRGIRRTEKIQDLRGSRHMKYIDSKTKEVSHWPAILGMIRSHAGDPLSIHRTYLLPDGTRRKKIMTPLAKITGGAIRLTPIENRALLVAEGIESALAGREAMSTNTDCGVWSAFSANNMKVMKIPYDEIDTLIICADADKTFTGEAAAFELAHTAVLAKVANVLVAQPNQRGRDMVDVLNGECKLMITRNR